MLFLENGGGKSVLLKLVFSVLLPGRRQVVGTTSTDVLPKFVLGEDVAHVACEWMHTGTGELLVTGKVSEWPGHVVSADAQRLSDAWYSFRPGPAFGLDDLPFTADGRRVTMASFKDRLYEQHCEDPAGELVWETAHREWTRHLVDVGLDPELFRYQRAMNAEEGEAAEAFSFGSDEAFVDFLLRAVLDPEEPQTLADLVAGYARQARPASGPLTERDFVEGTLERLEPLRQAERAAGTARAAGPPPTGPSPRCPPRSSRAEADEDERLAVVVGLVDAAREAEAHAVDDERRLREITTELRRRSPRWSSPRPNGSRPPRPPRWTPRRPGSTPGWPSSRARPPVGGPRRRGGCAVSSMPSRNAPARAACSAGGRIGAGRCPAGDRRGGHGGRRGRCRRPSRRGNARARPATSSWSGSKEAAGHQAAVGAARATLREIGERVAAAGLLCAETSVGALVSAHDRVGEDVAAHVAAAAARAEVDAQDASRRARGGRRRAQRAASSPAERRHEAVGGATRRGRRPHSRGTGRRRVPAMPLPRATRSPPNPAWPRFSVSMRSSPIPTHRRWSSG